MSGNTPTPKYKPIIGDGTNMSITNTTNRSSNVSSTTSSTMRYTSQQAQGLALQAFQAAIGRAPTSQELSDFLSALNAAEASSPSVTSGSTYSSRNKVGTLGQADVTSSTSAGTMTSGGVDEQAFAQQYAMSLPGAPEYQKATTYFDAFNQVMNSRGGRGL
jgi:hypothetical protein